MHTAGRRGPCRQGNKRAVFPGCPRQPGSKETPPAPHPVGNPLYGCPDDEKMPGTDKKTGPFHHAGRLRALSPQKLFHSPPAAQGAADPERHPEFFPEARVVPQKRGLSGSSPHPQGKTHQGPFPVRGKTASPHRGTVVPRGMPAGLRPDAVRGHTPPRSQKADLEEHQPEIRPGFTGAQPYQTRRYVSILPVLGAILSRTSSAGSPSRPVCPPNWEKKWREVRRRSGILKKSGWVQDVLRHTYASYHLAHFCNQNLLQKEMGHSSPSLLLARYLNMDGITSATGAMFWTYSFIPPAPLKKD